MAVETSEGRLVADLEQLKRRGRLVLQAADRPIVLIYDGGKVYAVDNRCPHMGFPLHRGTVNDGILTCHWHHARFDLCTGGTFDQFADDVRTYPVEVRDGQVLVDVSQEPDMREHYRRRLEDGLEQQINLVVAKSVIALMDGRGDPREPFELGLRFGARYRQAGWGQGLTMHTALMNLVPELYPEDRPLALYHGLAAVAQESSGEPPRFPIDPLPDNRADIATLKRWFRRFVEVRDSDGAERCIATAVRSGASSAEVADMMFAAVTDHRYISTGHPMDFTNKAFEALEIAGWEHAELVLTSLARGYANATRMEESNSWRNPVDLVELLERAFRRLPEVAVNVRGTRSTGLGRIEAAEVLLGDDPEASIEWILDALASGATGEEVAGAVAYAAARRMAHFHISNEFGDWDTVLHTFSFANAVHQGMKRAPSVELLRGVLDAAMSVYLDRFLNVPATPLPKRRTNGRPDELLPELLKLFDQRQQVNEAGQLVADYLGAGGGPEKLKATLGSALLREDRNFHTIQTVEAAFRQHSLLEGTPEATHVLVAAARYLAAHAATPRAQLQTYTIANRLHRGEKLYEDEEG